MSDVEALYQSYGILADAGEKAGEHAEAFEVILAGVKGSDGAKKLAADFICKFAHYFPDVADRAIEAQLDLCEEEDAKVRQKAIRSLPQLARDNADNSQIGDILTQLLQTEDPAELKIVETALSGLMERDARGALAGLFYQINSGESEVIRDKALVFMSTAVVSCAPRILHPSEELERYIVEECKKALGNVTAEEFPHFMKVLASLRTLSNPAGAQELANCIAELADLGSDFQASDVEAVDRLFSCSRQALPFFKRGSSPMRFISYFMDQVLPALAQASEGEGDGVLLEALRVLAELFQVAPEASDCQPLLEPIMQMLLEHLPAPPASDESDAAEEPQLHFSVVECLLFIFQQLVKQCPDYLTNSAESATRLQTLRTRLQYFGLGCQSAMRKLKADLAGKSEEELKKDEQAKTKVAAVKTMQNINALIKVFFKNPPGQVADFTLSWVVKPKRTPVTAPAPIAVKRTSTSSAPLSLEGGELPKRPMTGKEMRELYQTTKKDEDSSSGQSRGGWRGRNYGQSRGSGRGRGGGRGYGRGYGQGYNRGYRGRGGWRNNY